MAARTFAFLINAATSFLRRISCASLCNPAATLPIGLPASSTSPFPISSALMRGGIVALRAKNSLAFLPGLAVGNQVYSYDLLISTK